MWHRADLASVLVACWCLDDEERREHLFAEQRELRRAQLVNLSVWDPKRLTAELEHFFADLDRLADGGPSNSDIIDAANAYLAGAGPK